MNIPFRLSFALRLTPLLAAACLAGCGKPTGDASSSEGLPAALPNAGFEQGLKGWKVGATDNGMSHPDAEAAKDGKLGLRVVDKDATLDSRVGTERFSVKGGKRYALEFDARNLGGRGIGAFIFFYNSAGDRLELPGGQSYYVEVEEGASEWKRYRLEATAQADATEIEAVIRTNQIAIVQADFDNVTLVEVKE